MDNMSGDNLRASWVPVTPVKQIRDPICEYEPENETIEPSNFVSGQICQENEVPESSQVSRVLYGTGFPDSSSRSSLTNSVEATTEFSGTTFSMDCVDKSIPFSDLLALANAAAAKTASGSNNFVGSIPITQFEDKEATQGNETNQPRKETRLDNNVTRVVQQTERASDDISTQVLEKNNSGPGSNVSLGRSTPAQQKPRRKRYMPKVVREGQPKRTPKPKTPKPVNPNDTPKPKRKYVRKKVTSTPQNTPFVDLTETDEETPPLNTTNTTRNIHPDSPSENLTTNKPQTPGRPQRSCRKSLNFDILQEEDESSSYIYALDFESQIAYAKIQSAMQIGQGPEESAEKGQLYQIADVQSGSARGKCRIVFSDVTHDKELNVVQMIDLNSPPASNSPNDSNCSTSTPVSKEEQARRMKRGHQSAAVDLNSTNIIGARHNSVQAYLAMLPVDQDINNGIPGVHFPTIYKKRRTEKCQNLIEQTTEFSPKVNWGHGFTSDRNYMSFAAQCTTPPSYRTMLDTGNKGTRKKRSKGSTRVRDIASLTEIAESIQSTRLSIKQGVGTSRQSNSHAAKTTKKRTRRNHRASGSMFSVDALIEHLRHLDINAERNQFAYPNAWARSYNSAQYQEQNAIVVYQRDGTLVTVKKRKSRPRVELDDETTRVWKLLLQDINSEGINGTDEEKEKWWEEERRIFDGRANSFIKCMHLIQGDRTFSRWKGSVVDSVVGVFLTQNVSDHLSSSAYMSLAAQFPLVVKSNHDPLSEDVANIPVNDLEACVLNPDDTIEWLGIKSKQPTLNQESTMIQGVECNEDIEVVNSNESSVSSMGCLTPKDISSCNCSEIGGTTSFVELLHLAEQNKYNGDVAMLSGIHWEGKETSCSAESGSSRENASQGVVQHMVDSHPNNVQDCTQNDIPDSSIQVELDIVCQPQTASPDLKHELKSSDQERIYQVEKISYDGGPGTLEEMGGTGASDISGKNESSLENHNSLSPTIPEAKTNKPKRARKAKKPPINWDSLRKEAQANGERVRTADTFDSVDWEAVRLADFEEVAQTIRERGMNNMLAERIKAFLNRLVSDHGSIDLEWLRDVPPDKAKEYLLSIRGLGLKSVECVRLLTLHHIAFPVDTNVGRIAVRLGWVPLQPLPESLQLHLLELYPVLESIQKYLWPRLCKLDQRTLYELHYQMITFGKVFCTKSKPNCNACPLRGECRHFASAFASARLALPGPEEKSIVASGYNAVNQNPGGNINRLELPASQSDQVSEVNLQISQCEPIVEVPASPEPIVEVPASPEPIVEVPASPEPERAEVGEDDIEDFFDEDPDEIPTIKLNIQEFTQTLQEYIHRNMELQQCDVSKALVALTPEAASIPAVKLKNVSRLRTEHQVYELPDTHPLLDGHDRREPDDPCSYLLAIWTPGETADSIQPPAGPCSNQESGGLCSEDTCFACSSTREAQSQTVRGTILIPCRTAMRGSFPLNGTYFQVNEVFADHASSISPLNIPRYLLWNLPRKTVYFGTSVTSIFRGMQTKDIQFCFWRGFVCVRGFDRETRSPRPLMARLHFPPSKLTKGKEKKEDE